MKDSFWSNKPVEISNNSEFSILNTKDEMLKLVNKEIELNRFKLKYHVLNCNDLSLNKIDNIVKFINKNYVESYDESYKLIYTVELFKFYCKNCIILEFHPQNKDTIVGYIIGKKSSVSIYNNIFDTSEVNFLCIIPSLRSLGLASYMINVLSKEIVFRYNIITSHYTVSVPIKSLYFGEKYFYHRFINIDNLYKIKYIKELTDKYSIFNYDKKFDTLYTLEYKTGCDIDSTLATCLYDKYINYCKNTYDIYEFINYDDFKRGFLNKMFHHFIIYNKDKSIVSYVSLFRLDTFNVNLKDSIKTGYYYYMFFDDKSNIVNYLEYINKYIYDNKIFDILTFTDIFDINYSNMNCIKGSSIMRYYFYNMKIPRLINSRNGMITI
jgi:hypothetical protein